MKRKRVVLERVAFGFPAGGSVTVPFAMSLVGMIADNMEKPDNERMLTRVIPASGLYVAKNRNTIVKGFLKGGTEEWLLQVDTDIQFPVDLYEWMVRAAHQVGAKVLAANVRLGAHTHSGYARSGWLWAPMEKLPEERCFKVGAAATAVFLVHREVLEKIKAEGGECWFNHLYLPHEGTSEITEVGEDLAFCERAAAVGYDTWLLRGLKIKHYKTKALVELDENGNLPDYMMPKPNGR